jgi:hypothetical protein
MTGKGGHGPFLRCARMAAGTFLFRCHGNFPLGESVALETREIIHSYAVYLFIGMTFQANRLIRRELMLYYRMTCLANHPFIEDMLRMAI